MSELLALAPPEQVEGSEGAVSTETNQEMETTEDTIQRLLRWSDPRQTNNIAEELIAKPIDGVDLNAIGMEAIREAELDDASRKHWMDRADAALALAMQKSKAKSYPWVGAANIILPMMTEAADQFAARAYPAIIANKSVVKGVIHGHDKGVPEMGMGGQQLVLPDGTPAWRIPPGFKRMVADTIGEHMSWQFLEEMDEWEAETDKMLHVLPIVGCEFRKTYFDPSEGRNFSVRVPAKDLIINYWAKSLSTAPRLTEVLKLYPHEVQECVRGGYYVEQDYGPAENAGEDKDAPLTFYEQHRRIDLDGDGYAEPYILTICKDSMKVARIIARYDPEGIKFRDSRKGGRILTKIVPVHYYTKYDFLPNKEGGIYGQGFGQVLLPINEAANAVLNMMLDAGHLQTTGGGFLGKGLSMHSGQVRFRPGEWKFVNSAGADIQKAIVPLVHQGPSDVLFQLLGTLMEAGKDVSSVKDVLTGEVRAQTMSPTVFMALVEQGLKVFTGIYKRIHRSLQTEFDKVYRLNSIYLEEQASYRAGNQWKDIPREFYQKGWGVEPVSDPSMVADAQRVARAQYLFEIGKENPHVNMEEATRRAFDAGNIERVDDLIAKPGPDPQMLATIAELELKQIQVKAQAIQALSAAVKNLSDAHAQDTNTELGVETAKKQSELAGKEQEFASWAMQQVALMQQAIEGLNGNGKDGTGEGAGEGDSGAAGGSAANPQPGQLPLMEGAPANSGLASLSDGLPGGAAAGPSDPVGTGPAA
jgi:chaperonin GroES